MSRSLDSARDLVFRAKRRAVRRFSDVELWQLRSMQRAYQGKRGPELLVFGDSAMFWTNYRDKDRRHLVDMIRDETGRDLEYEALMGPSYHGRIVMAYLSGLAKSSSRPKVVVVPTSVLLATHLFLEHPSWSYISESKGIREAVRGEGGKRQRLERPGADAFDAYDRLPAPSLYGARRTAGELRLILNSVPTTPWQTAVRMRHLMDYYNAEELTAESPGVKLVEELGSALADLGLRSVAYVAPVNHQVLRTTLGQVAVDQLTRNAKLVETAFMEGANGTGRVVNAAFECPSEEFADPVHLNDRGRLRLARRIAAEARLILEMSE